MIWIIMKVKRSVSAYFYKSRTQYLPGFTDYPIVSFARRYIG